MGNVIEFKKKQKPVQTEELELAERIKRIKNSIQNINRLMAELRGMKEKE